MLSLLHVIHNLHSPGNFALYSCQYWLMYNERGLSPSVEAAIIIPGLVLIVGLVIVLARIVLVKQAIQTVAEGAARAASLSRGIGAGESAARNFIADQSEQLGCLDLEQRLDLSGLAAPVGTAAETKVELRCTFSLADVVSPVFPWQYTVTVTAISPIDRYRSR